MRASSAKLSSDAAHNDRLRAEAYAEGFRAGMRSVVTVLDNLLAGWR